MRLRRGFAAVFSVAILATAFPGEGGAATPLPQSITSVMRKPRYAHAKWNLLVTDLKTGQTIYQLDPDRMAFTGSVRKLYSVGLALNALGAAHRFTTPVYKRGSVNGGVLQGDLVLVAAGDLTFGGRSNGDTVTFTDFDHNDANNLGTAMLTPQNPLRGLDALARQVRASGIRSVQGNVLVDDRLFQPYRVPNGNLLITPIILNENMVDVWLKPTLKGESATFDYRPKTPGFYVRSSVATVAAGKPDDVALSNKGLIQCAYPAPCTGTVSGQIPIGYRAPLSGSATFVRTFRVEDPASFARIAFVQALERAGVRVSAPLLARNDEAHLPARDSYAASDRVAAFVSPPYSEDAKLILKVSLNLGANLSLSLFGLTKGQRTVAGALAAERKTLVGRMHIPANEFNFPTNGSGSPDSQAAARATVALLRQMSRSPYARQFRAALPVLGVDGSLADTGRSLPAKGHVFAKTGTTIDASGLKAQVLAGYIDAKSGKRLAFALYVNNAGKLKSIDDVAHVFTDEALITNAIYLSQ